MSFVVIKYYRCDKEMVRCYIEKTTKILFSHSYQEHPVSKEETIDE